MLISAILDKVSKQIVDVNNVRWTRAELLDYLNFGLSALVVKRPNIARTTATQATTSGEVAKPADAYSIINVNHVDGRAVQYVDVNKISQLEPNWRLETGTPVAWTRSEFDNDMVYLYPAPSVSVDVELVYAKDMKVTLETDDFPIQDIYVPIIFDYIIYRAFDKDSENPNEAARAQYHLTLFRDALGEKDAADVLKEQTLVAKEKLR